VWRDSLTRKIVEFLTGIGIEVVPARLEGECFLPGILVEGGRLLVDEEKLTYPGDLLHEAGHLAVAPASARPGLGGEVVVPGENIDVLEVGVTAWAYAATVHLGLDPKVLFHEGGYRGQSAALIYSFTLGVYPGVKDLLDAGMTALGEDARAAGVPPYPHMLKWLRD